MAETSRWSRGNALAQYSDASKEDDASRVYRFQVLLPSGVSSRLTLYDPEISVSELLLRIKRELGNTHWDVNGKVYLTDLLDRTITDKMKLSNFDTKSVNILKLHDGNDGSASIFENMWDLTPTTDLLQELPAEYSTESALADLTDNALQALWSNDQGERKLIRIILDKEKIVIFDTGRGMDGSDSNSISKWGTMGSSNHRVFRKEGIGRKAPYLLPFFGMFRYGGTIASMHLGKMAIVSSKTKESKKVFTLHLSREALLKNSSSKNSEHTWKTAGGLRDPSKGEILLSPHQSFTQVNYFLNVPVSPRFKQESFPYMPLKKLHVPPKPLKSWVGHLCHSVKIVYHLCHSVQSEH